MDGDSVKVTYGSVISNAVEYLKEKGVPDAELDARYLLEFVTGMSFSQFFLHKEDRIKPEERERFETLIGKRGERIPLQYLTGTQEFMGFTFEVSKDTLIPRQDTEILVEEAMKVAEGKRVLDLCTGTGCILLSLAKLCKVASAVGCDISEGAVETAKRNAVNLDADATFYVGDLFEALEQGNRYDLIVSNPPYICSEVIQTLSPEVKDHEPHRALDGDSDGLFFYRKIVKRAFEYLANDGWLLFEIGCEQADAVSRLMAEAGFTEIKVRKDYAGLDRVVSGKLSR